MAFLTDLIERAVNRLLMLGLLSLTAPSGKITDDWMLRLVSLGEPPDRTGLVKKEQVEVSGNAGGIFILPPKTANADVA